MKWMTKSVVMLFLSEVDFSAVMVEFTYKYLDIGMSGWH